MVLRYIGYGTTNSDGIAKLDHDANGNIIDGYVGTGEGEITFVASKDSNPSASSILSNRVTIMDNPLPMQVVLSISDISVDIGTTVTLTATVKENGQSVGSGETVTFKRGTTTIGTSQTNSSGIATYSYVTDTVGTLSIIAVCNDVYSTAKSLIVHKIATNLSLNVPQLVYSDEFNITGVLTNSQNIGISGASVKLKWQVNGTTYESSAETTNNNGEVTFHRSAPTSIQTFKFWLTFDGDANYEASNSSEETRIVGKETSVLNVNAPASLIYGETLNMAGNLLDNDGSPIASATVVMYVDGSSTGISILTQSDGSFSISSGGGLSVGTHTFNFVYAGDSYYTNVSLQKTVVVTQSYNSIVCSANKSILSYADNDKATLYAQLMNNGSSASVSNVSVTFKKGSTVLGSALTDATGLATLTDGYSSAGVGDISITATDSNFVSETFTIQDIWKYVTSFTSWSGTSPIFSDFTLPTDHEIIVGFNNAPNIQVACSDTSNNWIYAWNTGFNNTKTINVKNSSNQPVTTSLDFDLNKDYEYKLSLEDNTIKLYVNNVLIGTYTTYDTQQITRKIRIYNNAQNVAYLKIKQL